MYILNSIAARVRYPTREEWNARPEPLTRLLFVHSFQSNLKTSMSHVFREDDDYEKLCYETKHDSLEQTYRLAMKEL